MNTIHDFLFGLRLLCSRHFWKAINHDLPEAITAATDDWIHTTRQNLHLPPDPNVEQRRTQRRPS